MRKNRLAFTLIEILVVLAIIAVLSTMGFATWGIVQAQAKRRTTALLVDSVVAAIEQYRVGELTIYDTGLGRLRSYRLWDWNADGVLDGYPERDEPPVGSGHPLMLAGYRGFWGTAMPSISASRVNAKGQVTDSWAQPLRIAFGANVYGGGIGVWSMGPDGRDGPFGHALASDNVTSWRNKPLTGAAP